MEETLEESSLKGAGGVSEVGGSAKKVEEEVDEGNDSEEDSGRVTKIEKSSQEGVEAGEEQDYEQEEILEAPATTSPRSKDDPEDQDEEEEEEDDFDDNTVSSEAICDDIELILYPTEEVQDLPDDHLQSPTLVRVTELCLTSSTTGATVATSARSGGTSSSRSGSSSGSVPKRRSLKFRNQEEPDDEGVDDFQKFDPEDFPGPGLSHSGVQTDITALETRSKEIWATGGGGGGRFGLGGLRPSPRTNVTGSKRLNWKSEMTLLPSKTKLEEFGVVSGEGPYRFFDSYSSPRALAKHTSLQDNNLSIGGSQFLRPSTLYRTRNLSRNLNRCESSSLQTLQGTGQGVQGSSDSDFTTRLGHVPRPHLGGLHFRSSGVQMSSKFGGGFARLTRLNTSLPDLASASVYDDPRMRRGGSHKARKHPNTNSISPRTLLSVRGFRKKPSSSEDEDTSSLIDDSERNLRKSIDMLLGDDLAFCETRSSTTFPYQPTSSRTSGYASARRYASQPALFSDFGGGYGEGDPFSSSGMGSPFLPRKISDMRTARYVSHISDIAKCVKFDDLTPKAKVILPNGQVSVVIVKEVDEFRDSLLIHTDTGLTLNLPFRKLVFAWKPRR